MSWSIESCSGTDARPQPELLRRAEVWADRLSLVCFGVLSLVMLRTLPDYGFTYDEPPHLRLGERVLTYYTGGLQSGPGLMRSVYGAGFDLCAAILRRISPWDEFRTNHLLCAFVAQLGLFGSWRLGRLLAGPLAGLASLLFLVLTPVYYGHQFNNPKDIPFAVGYVWGLYAIARLIACSVPQEPAAPFWRDLARRWRQGCWLALILGLAMSVRNVGAILIPYAFALLAARALDAWRLRQLPLLRELARAAALSLLGSLAGWAVMLLFWPGVQGRPLQGPADAFETLSNYTAYDSPTLLRGEHLSSNAVPWDYIPTYFLVQLPEWTSLCWLGGVIGLCAHSAWSLWRRRPIAWGLWLLVVAVLLPPAYAILKHSTLYNGLRHFLFLIPPLAVLAGVALSQLLRWLLRRRPLWALLPAALFSAFCVDQTLALWRLHPHQHVFFNRASGGAAAAIDRYETEYYGGVYQELHGLLLEAVWKEHRDAYLDRVWTVSGCGSKLFFARNLPLNFQFLAKRDAGGADYYASYVRDDCLHRFRDRSLIGTVARDGAVLAAARDVKLRKRAQPVGANPP